MKPYNSHIQVLGKNVMIGGFYGVRTEEMPLDKEYRGTVTSASREKLVLSGREYLVRGYRREPTKNRFEQLDISLDEIVSFVKLD